MTQQVNVTLEVDADLSKTEIFQRILTGFEITGIELVEISNIKEEAEIYGNE